MRSVKTTVAAFQERVVGLIRKDFVRQVGVLAGGTAFAQALTILLLPILTRIYTPAHFSVLAVYVSMLGLLSVAACLRLEIAIPLPERDADAVNVLAVALTSAIVIAVLVALVVVLFPRQIVHLVHQPPLRPYLWMLPLGLCLSGSYAAFQYWAIRKRRFSAVARTRVTQTIGGSGTQIALGAYGWAPFGLLFGQMISSGAGVVGLARAAFQNDRNLIKSISWSEMRRMFRCYDRFPKYSTLEGLANVAGVQLPVIIIAATAIGPEAGYLMLATRVMAAPMALIGSAVGQVYLSRAPQEFRNGGLGAFTISVMGGLAKAGLGPLAFFGIVAPVLFPLVFGSNWGRAGQIVAWMTPWFMAQFLSSPVSMTMHVTGHQRGALILQVIGLLVRVGGVIAAACLISSHIVEVYAVSGLLFYVIYIVAVVKVSGGDIRSLINKLKSSFPIIGLWVGLALICRVLIETL